MWKYVSWFSICFHVISLTCAAGQLEATVKVWFKLFYPSDALPKLPFIHKTFSFHVCELGNWTQTTAQSWTTNQTCYFKQPKKIGSQPLPTSSPLFYTSALFQSLGWVPTNNADSKIHPVISFICQNYCITSCVSSWIKKSYEKVMWKIPKWVVVFHIDSMIIWRASVCQQGL